MADLPQIAMDAVVDHLLSAMREAEKLKEQAGMGAPCGGGAM